MASRPTERARQYALTRFGELALEGSSRRDLQLRSTALIAEVVRHPDAVVAFYKIDDEGTFVFTGSNRDDGAEPGDALPEAYMALCRTALETDEPMQNADVDGVGQVAAITTSANHSSRGLHLVRQPSTGEFSEEELIFVQTLGRLIAVASERQLSANQPRQPHQHDPLTRLPNQQLFMERLEAAIDRTTRSSTEIGLLLVDIDHFDMINTTYGRAIGDRLLANAATRLRDALRPGDLIARFHGDTFIVLCEELREPAGVAQVATRLQRAVDDPFDVDGGNVHLGLSIGCQTTDERRPSQQTSASLLRDADIALGQAKKLGRGRSVTFSEDLSSQSADRILIETELRAALANDELTLQYQPIIELATNSIFGAEALVRWNHPERGPISPGYFIAIAKESALIGQVDSWVLNEAVTSASTWSRHEEEPRVISVNVSDRQFAAGNLSVVVTQVLEETQTFPGLLCFEFAESALISDLDTAVRSLNELQDLGVLLAIDHFGTGHLPLNALGQLPIDIVKVDRTFVRDLCVGGPDNAMAAAVINLAQTLGMEALASGVETEEQLAVLRELGCDLAQGYHFSPPLTADRLEYDLVGYRKSLLRSDA